MQKEWQEGMQECMTSPEMQRCIQESSIPRKDDFVKRLSLGLADRSVRLAKRTVDSAALVFAHTLLDEALSEACRISFQADPRRWLAFVNNRKVELGRLKTKTLMSVKEEMAREHVLQLERESMTKRLEVLNGVCVPRLKGEAIPTAWIKQEALRDFDRLRQRIIHGQPFLQRSVVIPDQLHFAKLAGFSVLILVSQAYDLLSGGPIEPRSDRTWLRLCAILRREFPEFVEFFQDVSDNSGKRGG